MAITVATNLAEFASCIGTDSETIKVKADEGRVGIGTTNPQATLQVGTGVTIDGTAGVITATAFAIGISSAGTSIASKFDTLNFVGTGNTFLVNGNTIDVSISGGAGGASKIYDSTVFAYDNVISSNVTIESPYKVATLYTSPDVTTDINDGVTVTVDDGCVLNFIDI